MITVIICKSFMKYEFELIKTTNDPFPLMLSTFPSLPITSHHFSSLPITSHHFPSLPITSHHFPSLPITSHHFPSLPACSSCFHRAKGDGGIIKAMHITFTCSLKGCGIFHGKIAHNMEILHENRMGHNWQNMGYAFKQQCKMKGCLKVVYTPNKSIVQRDNSD